MTPAHGPDAAPTSAPASAPASATASAPTRGSLPEPAEPTELRPWGAEAVLEASNAWSWVPDFADSVRTDEYLVIGYPATFLTPTVARVLTSDRDPRDLVDEVHDVARGLGRDRVWWTVSDATHPAGLEAELERRGGAVVERSDVLALDLTSGRVPDLGVPPGITARRVVERADVLEALLISQLAFGGNEPDDAEVDLGVAEIDRGLADDSGGRFLAFVDGRAASTGGWTLVGPVARLWGAGTRPELRGHGAYRAVLDARLRVVLAAGATLALTHGRVETSSPILRSVGFRRHGEQRQLVVDLS